ncbi:nucleotide pyrophosphohydrolase [Vreelandella sp. H-I2]
MDVKKLQAELQTFSSDRDWDQFHTPKNLAMALSVECSELVEEFQWLTAEESLAVMKNPESAARVRNEIADIAAYLLRITDKLDIDIEEALSEKMNINEKKYPVAEFKGSARKYNR